MKPPYPSQWAAIEDADRHVLVVAGAGTGKTFTVVQRILWMLGVEINGRRHPRPARLDEIAAITFTNQAARELRDALREALRDAGRADDAWHVDESAIGTIHSFCAELLRANALRRGEPPPGSVLEEGEAVARATQAARDALVEAVEHDTVPGLAELLAMWDTGRVDKWVVNLMRRPDLVRSLMQTPAGLDARERGLVGLADLALRTHEGRLTREGAVDFDRMILWTRDLLRVDEAARRSLQRRLRLLVIDEFQDVDPAQKEIAWWIGRPDQEGGDTPRLMLVGDPKQSIYRFRHADVTVWNEVEREFESRDNCAVRPLVENFRSLPAVLAFVDASVGPLMDKSTTDRSDDEPLPDYEVQYRPVQPVRADEGVEGEVELLVTPARPDGKAHLIDAVRQAEAAAVARRACELHDGGIEWRDMALLLAAWASEAVYTTALRAAGVPVYVLRDVGFYDRREIVDLILALQVVRDPGADASLMGFLRGPFVGLRDDSLLHIARQARSPYWAGLRKVVLPDAADDERLRLAIERLWRHTRLRDRIPVAELLEGMIRESGFMAHLQLQGEDGLQAMANVRRFLSGAGGMEAGGIGDFLRAIREAREREDRIAQARLYAESENVMLITSIHVAKGLEWPVVFWADVGAGDRPFNEELLVTRDTIRLGTPEQAKNESPEWQAVRGRLIGETAAERRRLWYVAATRARDRLIVSGIPHGARRGSLAYELLELFPGLDDPASETIRYAGHDGVPREARVREASVPDAEADDTALTARAGDERPVANIDAGGDGPVESDMQADREADEPASDPEPLVPPAPPASELEALVLPPEPVTAPVGLIRHSATEILAHERCARRHAFKYVWGIHEPSIGASHDELITAVARGQIVHDVLERIEQEKELEALLEDAIGRWDETAPPPESERGIRYRAHLTDEVRRVLDHADYAGIVARPGARRELAFLQVRPDGSATQGFIDLAAPDAAGDGLELLDVKTTQCDAAVARRKAEQYRPQRDVYTVAAGALAGRPVTRFAFQFSRAQTQIAIEIDAAERADSARRLDEFVRVIESGEAPLTMYPDECGFCGYRRVGLCPGVFNTGRSIESVLRRLRSDRFRRSFRLGPAELEYLRENGLETALTHARDFIIRRLAPANPSNDGRQTPWRGHPVFVAQHATATCCRVCLEKWHGITRGEELSSDEIDYAVAILRQWLIQADPENAGGDDPASRTPSATPSSGRRAHRRQLDLFSEE